MRLLPFVVVLACAACNAGPSPTRLDPGNHVERVLEDVTAILEGMAAAHAQPPVVVREPGFRSSGPRARE